MSNLGKSEDLVESVALYNTKPVLWHGYICPFIIFYAVWGYVSANYLTYEASLIALAVIITVQTVVYLFCHWSVHVCCYLTCSRVKDPSEARLAKVVPTPSNGSAEIVKIRRAKNEDGEWNIWFIFQECKYEWDHASDTFLALEYPTSHLLKTYLNHKGYQDENEIHQAYKTFGPNKTHMKIPSFRELFVERATAPFFVFQVFCVLLWSLDEYWMYSIFTLVMLIVFECTLVHQQLRNMSEIKNMGNKPYRLQAYRNRKWRPLNSDELLPGDIVSVCRSQNDEIIPCDMLLLRGPCIVDESMLTGESVPQMKEPIESEFLMGTETIENSSLSDRRLDLEVDSKLRVLSGGTKIVQHTPPSKSALALRAPDNGCICYVLRTGFSTSQGKLLRTILYGVKRVTANNLESFFFILFLLVFAIIAAAYVWIKGTEDPDRNRYKLFLECTLILTSVVPPELPIELSLAVNSSVLSLTKLGVFSTEPFRIPFAGKTEICCFDKTGTLTSDNLIIEGIATSPPSLKGSTDLPPIDDKNENNMCVDPKNLNPETVQTIAACHSLMTLEDGTVLGDPLEKVALKWIDWDINKDVVVPKKSSSGAQSIKGIKIFHRFHFSSALKRMSVVAGYADGTRTEYFVAVKGAPEVLEDMLAVIPETYEETYLTYTRRGARVLALGMKQLGHLSSQDVRQLSREDIESELIFLGFLIVSCPLKSDSKRVVKEIMDSSHKVIIITGDSALTACHVAKQLCITQHNDLLLFNPQNMVWESIDGETKLDFLSSEDKSLVKAYDLCMTGDGLNALMSYQKKNVVNRLVYLVPHITVYARMAPKQKEWIINGIKSRGHIALMCGDGTNDVGALKHAHVGVAILSHDPEWMKRREKMLAEIQMKKNQDNAGSNDSQTLPYQSAPGIPTKRNTGRSSGNSNSSVPRNMVLNRRGTAQSSMRGGRGDNSLEKQINKMLKELEQNESQVVKLGDASIAAPFFSKMSSVECICHVIKQGRCTLVTTLQMFKILALNALVLAYSQSVLYLDGIKLSDSQATFQGLLLASCFLFISHSKPLPVLSKKRPLPNIFNAYTLLTVLLQFSVHFLMMIYLVKRSLLMAPEDRPEKVDLEKKFEPNLLNTTVYMISLTLQISTFLVNYRGHPFMESIMENKPFFFSILGSSCTVVALVIRLIPELNDMFEIVPIPTELQKEMLMCFLGDLTMCYIFDRLCMWLFGEGKLVIK